MDGFGVPVRSKYESIFENHDFWTSVKELNITYERTYKVMIDS